MSAQVYTGTLHKKATPRRCRFFYSETGRKHFRKYHRPLACLRLRRLRDALPQKAPDKKGHDIGEQETAEHIAWIMRADIEAGKGDEHGQRQRKPAVPAPPGPQEDQGDGKNVCRTCSCKNKRRNESKTYSQYLTNIANRMHNHPLRGYGASHLQLQSPQKSNVTSYRRRGSPANCPPRRRRAAR